MNLEEFEQLERGPYLFDLWRRKTLVHTEIGEIPLELHVSIDASPSEEMLSAAENIANWASSNGAYILDLIYGHYRYAEANNWLAFWNVEKDLPKSQILKQVESITLCVDEDGFASLFADPKWDPEHKLDLAFINGTVKEVNDERFKLENEVLYPVR